MQAGHSAPGTVPVLDYQGQVLALSCTGQIISADETGFQRDVAGQGGEEFTARRK